MQKLSKNLKVWLYATFILTGLAILLLTVSVFTGYDSASGYFEPSFIYSIFKGICVAVVALAVVAFIMTPKGELNGDSPLTGPVMIPSAFIALVAFGIGVVMLGGILKPSILTNTFVGLSASGTLLLVLGALFSFISVIYFILNCFPQDGRFGERHALTGFAVPIAVAIYVAVSYFDLTVSMNAPIKLLTHFSLIFFMLWMAYELRVPLKKAMPRCYFSFGLVAMLFSGVASLPWLIGFLAAGLNQSTAYPTYLLYNLVTLAIFCYTAVRLTVYVFARDIFERIAEQTPPEEETDDNAENNSEAEDEADLNPPTESDNTTEEN